MAFEDYDSDANLVAFEQVIMPFSTDLEQVARTIIWRDAGPHDWLIPKVASALLNGYKLRPDYLEGCARQVARRQTVPIHEVLAAIDDEMLRQLTVHQYSTAFAPDDWYLPNNSEEA